jgi:hypothetical protein
LDIRRDACRRVLRALPGDRAVREPLDEPLERRDDARRPFDLARVVREVRVLVDAPFLLRDLLELRLLERLLERFVCVAISSPSFPASVPAAPRGRSHGCYPDAASQTPTGCGMRSTDESLQSAIRSRCGG